MQFGDNINDKKMIENAGIGIAMGQSTPIIREIADYVTENNDNEGVKKAIEKFCWKLKKEILKIRKRIKYWNLYLYYKSITTILTFDYNKSFLLISILIWCKM